MNQDEITVLEYRVFKAIRSLDQETQTKLIEFLWTHTDSDIEAFKAGLVDVLATKE